MINRKTHVCPRDMPRIKQSYLVVVPTANSASMNILLIFSVVTLSSAHSLDWKTDVVRRLTDALVHADSRYNEPFLKHSNRSQTVVKLNVLLMNLIDFDVSKGTLKLFAVFDWTWTDYSLRWDEYEFDQSLIRLPVNKIWFPLVYIQNTADGTDALSVAESVEVTSEGSVHYETPQVLTTLCSPDVSKYPYDVHICQINIAPLLDNPGFVLESEYPLDLTNLWKNEAWNVSSKGFANRATRYVDYYIELRRYAFFLMLNLVAPVLILGVMNLFVFVLPQDSGERVGFSITILLSFVVFVSFTSEELPDSNTSTCIFNIFLVAQLIESALITLAVTLLSWVHHKTDENDKPRVCKMLVCPHKVEPRVGQVSDVQETEENAKLTWTKIASSLNVFCLIFFVSVSLIEKSVVLYLITS